MKIDKSKLSNAGDCVAMLCALVTAFATGLVLYMAATDKLFVAGLLSATLFWKWRTWIYQPVNCLIEKWWPWE